MLRISLILIFLATAVSGVVSHAGTWEHIGLEGRRVETIVPFEDFVYAGTDSGVFRCDLGVPDQWDTLGLSHCMVKALIIISEDTLLAGVYESDTALYRSTDGGGTWFPYENGYGGIYQAWVLSMARLTESSDVLFATGLASVSRTSDLGESWGPVYGAWGMMGSGMAFVHVNPNDESNVWAGGESTSHQARLLKSIDSGLNFEAVDVNVVGDNRCHDVAIAPYNSDRVWVSMEGFVRETRDGGDNWSTDLEADYYLYCIEIDPVRPENLYVSGYVFDQPLTLFVSRDAGVSWDTVVFAESVGIGILSMFLVPGSTTNTLYMGTMDGVYRYVDSVRSCCTELRGNVDNDPEDIVSLGDLTALIDILFISLGDPVCWEETNLDESLPEGPGSVSLGDLTALIDVLFISLDSPPACP